MEIRVKESFFLDNFRVYEETKVIALGLLFEPKCRSGIALVCKIEIRGEFITESIDLGLFLEHRGQREYSIGTEKLLKRLRSSKDEKEAYEKLTNYLTSRKYGL